MDIDYQHILSRAKFYSKDIFAFLREMIAIPSESGDEEDVIHCIKKEMEKVGFDRTEIDPMGNLMGYIGKGKHVIAIDGHIDTVGVGDLAQWKHDPYNGFEDEEKIYGRGSSDQEGGIASAVYAGKIIKDLGLENDFTLVVTATIMEEDCDGLCWTNILKETELRPEFVVISESTSCRIYRGHRGRMEIKVSTTGVSAHGSAPHRGDNAIYKMAPIISELEQLNRRLKDDAFLGKGTLAVSEIFSESPSRCAVADGCSISIDRRLTVGETIESALEEIAALEAVKNGNAKVEVYKYDKFSYTNYHCQAENYFPTWLIEEDHPVTESLVEAYKKVFEKEPIVDKWTFSTNGVSIMGRHGIPCIGFGPGHEDQAHAPNEHTWKNELIKATAMYAAIPNIYVKKYAHKMPSITGNLAISEE
ncbi:MAG: YgeY family selenium metabolism-linked hydrolase [Candidatus Neomarinimicrobiota bacterium]